jgi:sn-glycerol 3-phosphate transport system substrate-binding protein
MRPSLAAYRLSRLKTLLNVAFACLAVQSAAAVASTEIRFWHSMEGASAERLGDLIQRFNSEQSEFKVLPAFKTQDEATRAAKSASARVPHVVQLPDTATGSMLSGKHAVRPLYEVMAQAGKSIEPKSFYAPISAYYLDQKGRLMALPFNSATPVFFYNKDAFSKAGLDPNSAPKTWRDVQARALALYSAGYACSYTTAWPSWIHLENLGAWHDEPIATRSNGFDGVDAKLNFNGIMMIRHVAMLSSWNKSRIFTYSGRKDEADTKFARGECGMLTSSSAAYAEISERAKFRFGVAPMPYYDEFPGAPRNSIPGGAGLWAVSDKTPTEYKGVATFFAFLSRPEVQADWHQKTGYLPAGPAAYEVSRKQGFYKQRPGFEVFVKQLTNKVPSANSRGLRVANMEQVRTLVDDELEMVWLGKKTPKDALDQAVQRGNVLVRKL